MAKHIYYTRRFPVFELRALLRRWQRDDVFYEFRGRIVDAIEGHHERDCVSIRVDNDRQVKLFEHIACEAE